MSRSNVLGSLQDTTWPWSHAVIRLIASDEIDEMVMVSSEFGGLPLTPEWG